MTIRAGILIAVFSLAVVQSALAATVRSFVSKEGKAIISINGEIVQGDVQALKEAIRTANEANRLVSGIRLNSIGGNLRAGVEMAEIVRFAKVATVVANSATCASACFLIFAAGSEKFASHSAQVGVHGASDSDGSETVRSGAATVSMARVAKELGVSETIIGKMVVTPPSQMVWLSASDLRSIGATMTGKPVQTREQVASPGLDAPMPITPGNAVAAVGSQIQTSKQTQPPTWERFVEVAIDASANQNNGRPQLVRNCQPELKICNTVILIKGKSGDGDFIVRKAEDMKGKMVSRDFCTFNRHGDVRVCTDWDIRAVSRDMKSSKGEWVQVSDE